MSTSAGASSTGTGSGYQAAVLAECVAKVYTIEIVAPLGARARCRTGSATRMWRCEAHDCGVVRAADEREIEVNRSEPMANSPPAAHGVIRIGSGAAQLLSVSL